MSVTLSLSFNPPNPVSHKESYDRLIPTKINGMSAIDSNNVSQKSQAYLGWIKHEGGWVSNVNHDPRLAILRWKICDNLRASYEHIITADVVWLARYPRQTRPRKLNTMCVYFFERLIGISRFCDHPDFLESAYEFYNKSFCAAIGNMSLFFAKKHNFHSNFRERASLKHISSLIISCDTARQICSLGVVNQ